MSPEGSIVLFRRAGNGLPRAELRKFAKQLVLEVAAERQFECLLTDDRELRRLNQSFLGHDYPTDVLSFPSGMSGGFLGEMAISVNRASEQASEFGHSLTEEIKILMLHGVLHLLGMDHEKDRGAMGRAERRWRKRFGLPKSLIERK
jgi:probable rRNA maturation factor